jgi:hypothetical protein
MLPAGSPNFRCEAVLDENQSPARPENPPHFGSAAKEIAQMGAAIGREFSYALLALVAQRTEAVLRKALERLADAGLVLQRGAPSSCRSTAGSPKASTRPI